MKTEGIKEIDLRAIFYNKLEADVNNINIETLINSSEENIIDRNIITNKKWNKIQQTSYIESIFLGCALQPVVKLENFNHVVLIDGYNRFDAIKKFIDGELVLKEKGLKKLHFLSNKKFNDLDNKLKNYFLDYDRIQEIKYIYKSSDEKLFLSSEERDEMVKYLHLIYNTGLRLEVEEIQRAEYYNDYITNKIREEIYENDEFLDILEKLKLYTGHKKRNKIENILLNCRLLIASTYSKIENFAFASNISERIENNYLPNIKKLDPDKVYNDFKLNILLIYNNLICTNKWKSFPIMHIKPFIEVTYWLISVIREESKSDPNYFDFMKFLEYFGTIEEEQLNFSSYGSHYKRNILKRYLIVIEYYKKEYGIDLSHHIKYEKKEFNSNDGYNEFEDLSKKHFYYSATKMKLQTILNSLKRGSYNLRPIYQRMEVMNKEVSSKVIESMLLGIVVPHILVFENKNISNEKIVTEVVDGQQRLLSILGFLQEGFLNSDGELEFSYKNGYELKNLRILYEYNNYKLKSTKGKDKVLPKELIKKILDTDIYLFSTENDNGSSFNAIDHFVRLNKNCFTIKDNSYRMISLIGDTMIINYETEITKKFLNVILPKLDSNNEANMITLMLAYLFFIHDEKNLIPSHYTSRCACNWLKQFNTFKVKNINKNNELINEKRQKYIDALKNVNDFYIKISEFLTSLNKTKEDLFIIKKKGRIFKIYYYYLFCMLNNISKTDLCNNNYKIYDIINSFFIKIRSDSFDKNSIVDVLNFHVQQIFIFDSVRRNDFREKLIDTMK